jgi:hypothetical protein
MYKITVALAILGVFLAGGLSAAEKQAAPADDLKQVCKDGVTQASRLDVKGFALLWQNTASAPASAEEQDTQAHGQIQQLQVFQEQFGAFLSCELAEEKKATDSLRRYIYLVKYEKNVICWSFILYKAQDQWKILYFNWTDNAAAIDSLFR